jgi:hypothetical protein
MLHERLIDLNFLGHHLTLDTPHDVIGIYGAMLVLVARGHRRSRRALAIVACSCPIATPWALMFFMLGQMDEALTWCGAPAFSAAAIAVDRRSLVCHALLSLAGAITMIEFLLIERPTAAPSVMRALVALNPLLFISITVAVATLFIRTVTLPRTQPLEKRLRRRRFRNSAAL